MDMEIEKEGLGYGLKSLIYAATGLAVGAALGVLFAPAAGKETRAKVADWLKEKRDAGKAAIKERRERWIARHEKKQEKELAGTL